MICKRPNCKFESNKAHKCAGRVGEYCSRYCRDVHSYQQDAQAIYNAYAEELRGIGKWTVEDLVVLNNIYDARERLSGRAHAD